MMPPRAWYDLRRELRRVRPARVAPFGCAAFAIFMVVTWAAPAERTLVELLLVGLVAGVLLGLCSLDERLDAGAVGAGVLIAFGWLFASPFTHSEIVTLLVAGFYLVLYGVIRLIVADHLLRERRRTRRRAELAGWADVYADEHRRR